MLAGFVKSTASVIHMARPKNKREHSDAINKIMGLEGDDSINWTRLSTDDLMAFHIMLLSPESLARIGKNVVASMMPDGAKDMVGSKDLVSVVSDMSGITPESVMNNPDMRKLLLDRVKQAAGKSDLLKNRPLLKRILEQGMQRIVQEEKPEEKKP